MDDWMVGWIDGWMMTMMINRWIIMMKIDERWLDDWMDGDNDD